MPACLSELCNALTLSTHLCDAVGQLLVVHGDTLGLVQGHQRTRQELLHRDREHAQQGSRHTAQLSKNRCQW
jgi:hypothetical protein